MTTLLHQPRIPAAVLVVAALALLSQPAGAERYSVTVDPDSAEGQFLDLVSLQSDESKRLSLIEQFAQRFPKHQGVSWAYELLQLNAFQAGQWDRALTFGEKLVQIQPNDMEAAQLNIKAAESKGDPTTAKIWTDYMMRLSQRVLESPAPKDPEALEEWKRRTTLASQYTAQDEYAIYLKAQQSGDPRQQIKLLDELLKRNADTAYLPQALVIYLNAYRATGDHKNALLTAERILKTDGANEDALLMVAEGSLQRGASDRVVNYSSKLIEVMNTKKKPSVVRQEDWDKKKAHYAGTAYWMIGNTYINQSRFGQADANLRAALPLLRHSDQSAAAILFYLGWANYKMDNFSEAVRFYKQCMVYGGPYQEQAIKNLIVIKNEQGIQD